MFKLKSSEQSELNQLDDRELVAYWNILQASERTIRYDATKEMTQRHIGLVSEILRWRHIIHETGKRINVIVLDEPEPPEVRGENYCRNSPSAVRNFRSMK